MLFFLRDLRATNTFNFDQLPDMCLRKIFAFQKLQDLVRCRALNRQFKSYADLTEVTELAVREKKYFPSGYGRFDIWYQTDRTIDFQDAISPRAFAKSSAFKLRQQVKFLYINTQRTIDLKILNDMKQLVHLEFYSRDYSIKKMLSLPNLKVLNINRGPFVLNTPKLEVLKCNWISEIEFKYPNTIKRLECGSFHFNNEILAKLSNLEALGVSLDEAGLNEVPGHLSNLTGLKELHLKFDLIRGNCEDESALERIHKLLIRIIQERASLKRDDLKITLNDMLLIDEEHLPNFEAYVRPCFEDKSDLEDWSNRVDTLFRFINYKLIHYTDFKMNQVDFCELAALKFEISEDFFERFPRIRVIFAENPVDQEKFEWFLQNATALRVLELSKTTLDQAFFDRLPKLSSRLTHLTVYESFGLVTDFQFLLQLEHLEEFETDRAFHSFDLVATIFRESQALKSLRFMVGSASVKIWRSSALEDNYSLQFFGIERNLKWSELATLYERKRALLAASEEGMRIKRTRFE